MLQEPPESEYDLRFQLFGFPIRVAWSFWLGAVVFGWGLISGIDERFGAEGPGKFAFLILWVGCMLLSILIHELGHAVAFRFYGIHASIVLYHFGGLAIPSSTFNPGRSFRQLNEKEDFWIALAGPAAQFGSAMLLVGAVMAMGYQVDALRITDSIVPLGLSKIPKVMSGEMIESPAMYAIVLFYIFPSVLWALLNLVPVWPLDGGRIMNSLVLINGGRREQALWVSVIAAGLLTVYAFKNDQTFMGILFLSLGFSNYQMLQQNQRW